MKKIESKWPICYPSVRRYTHQYAELNHASCKKNSYLTILSLETDNYLTPFDIVKSKIVKSITLLAGQNRQSLLLPPAGIYSNFKLENGNKGNIRKFNFEFQVRSEISMGLQVIKLAYKTGGLVLKHCAVYWFIRRSWVYVRWSVFYTIEAGNH